MALNEIDQHWNDDGGSDRHCNSDMTATLVYYVSRVGCQLCIVGCLLGV
jgi:hypothetical protein